MIPRWTSWLGVFLGLWLLHAPGAAAQVNLVVSPIRVEQQLPPGGSETDIISVKNEGRQAMRLRVYLEDWRMDSQGNIKPLRPGENPRSCAAWIQVNPRDFRIEPGQSRDIRYTLTVPPGVAPGTYWSAIIFEALQPPGKELRQKKIGVYGRVAVVFYETAGQPENRVEFRDLKIILEKRRLIFKLALANPGAGLVRLKPGRIIIRNDRGQEAAKLEIPETPLMPGGARELEVEQDLNLPPGSYLAEAVVDVGRRELLGKRKSFTIGR
jgi:P pilus assembly chaperone PapD